MKTIRCAIYTRKSSEEGLELSFNSLHAQRESCEAYILSQAGEGWTCLKTEYDDGGISGGHMERPGLKSLIADIEAGKVNVIVVYKVDRLTRSLTDFSKLVEVFDAHDVSFVSVTQAFNTTNSMGRLTLNVLLSFAQFEREVTGERIRDKIALSRKRGLWTGGLPPLGYDAIDKKLVINKDEAEAVRHIYSRYCKLKNVRLLRAELTQDGYVSKLRTTKTRKATGGKPFERGALYAILKNQTYLGLTMHKAETFEGEHDPIIDKALFEKVQSILASNRKRDKHKTGSKDPSLLAGKIITETGVTLTPTHAQTHGRRYRYYVERRRGNGLNHQTRPIRLPAAEIEASVCREFAAFLTDPIRLMDGLGMSNADRDAQVAICGKAILLAERLTKPSLQNDDKTIIMKLVQKIELLADIAGYELILDLQELAAILELAIEPTVQASAISVSLKLKVCNNGKKVIVGNKLVIDPCPNPSMINALKLAHEIKEQYLGNSGHSLTEIAAAMQMNKRQIWRNLKMAFLAPDIQLAILSGTQPQNLCIQDLLDTQTAIDWNQQRTALGFT
ncbi:MAG: recombinase family protein [Alphaproteobacteria bacterium]